MSDNSSLDGLIATLASIFEDHDCEVLEAALQRNNHNLESTIEHLMQLPSQEKDSSSKQSTTTRTRQRSPQGLDHHPTPNKKLKPTSLQSWLAPARNQNPGPTDTHDQNPRPNETGLPKLQPRPSPPQPAVPTVLKQASTSLRSINQVLGQSSLHSCPSPAKPTKRATLPPLYLSTPQQVSEHLPCCSLLYGILPKELAWRLYDSMIQDCRGEALGKKPWIRNRWWLADREVQSPHSTAFFIAKPTPNESLVEDYSESAQYWYAGKPLEADAQPRYFLDEMEQARSTIESIVNQLLSNDPETLRKAQRNPKSSPIIRYDQEWDGPWQANVAASNCYRGSKENVGWHADQLTYLGPYPTIASLSLGTTRQFRLRPVANIHRATGEPMRTYSMSLGHNSLLVMHGGCQEGYKHCIPPQSSLDVFTNPCDPTDTRIERINITFRFYRPDFRPTRSVGVCDFSGSPTAGPSGAPRDAASVHVTPRCRCGIPAILRADQKGKVAAARQAAPPQSSSQQLIPPPPLPHFYFFWHCQAGQQHPGRGCNFFQILNFQSERRGPCLGDRRES